MKKPRTYRVIAHNEYLEIAKIKRRTVNKMREAIGGQLRYIRRDLKYISNLIGKYGDLPKKQMERLETIRKVYEQQKFMYDNQTHSVPDRIVSLSQPYIRPIVRGKAANPVEFGAKFDISLDEYGIARVEKISFDPYNEGDVLIGATERYRERTGHYPERVLADQIYRNRNNRQYCKEHNIRLSGPKLGRPKADDAEDKKVAHQDYTDRIAVERSFSLTKRKFGLGRIRTKLEDTTRSSIVLSITAMNVAKLQALAALIAITHTGSGFLSEAGANVRPCGKPKNKKVKRLGNSGGGDGVVRVRHYLFAESLGGNTHLERNFAPGCA